MSAARLSDGLLSAARTVALLTFLGARDRVQCSLDQLVLDFAALAPASRARIRNTVTILKQLGVLSDDQGLIVPTDTVPSAPAAQAIFLAEAIAQFFAREVATKGVKDVLRSDSANPGLWLDSRLAASVSEGLPFLLVEFGIAQRDQIASRFWRIRQPFEALFLNAVATANTRLVRQHSTITATQLEQRLRRMAECGREAEEWVVSFERRRLSGHPLLDQIRRISDDDVAAGYDILSFSGSSALHHDLFIEVKSYAGEPRFFWSRNEVEVAKTLGEEYSLYLVDRTRLSDPNYAPRVIRGPHAAFFPAHAEWTVVASEYECSLVTSGQ